MKAIRKRFGKIASVGIIAAALVLLFSIFRNYAVTPRIIIGPLKTFALIILAVLLSGTLSMATMKPTKARAAGWGLFALGCIIPAACSVLRYRGMLPELCLFFERFFVVIPALICCGFCLWVSSLPHMPLYRISYKALLWIILVVTAISLLPMLKVGYCWDDAYFSVEIPAMRLNGDSIRQRMIGEIIAYGSNGRLNPFATFQFLIFYLVPNGMLYKILLWLLTIIDVWLFYRFLLLVTGSQKTAAGTALILTLCFQLRTYHDALSGYYGLMQVMFLEMMLSLTAFMRALKNGKKKDWALCILFYLIPLLSYEMFYPMIAVYVVLAWYKRKSLRKALKACLPLIAILLLMFAATMILRGGSANEADAYNGTSFGLDPKAILQTLFYHVFAAFPLSYQHAGNDAALFGRLIPFNDIFTVNFMDFLRNIRWEDVLLAAFGVFAIGELSREERGGNGRNLVLGLLLLVLPGLVISVSVKYQQDLRLGLAYIPVYFQYFGAALIIYECFSRLRKRIGRREASSLCMGLFIAFSLVNSQNDRAVTEYLNRSFRYPRAEGEAALRAGILGEEFTEDKVLISNNRSYPWESGWFAASSPDDFYGLNAGFPLNVRTAAEVAAGYGDRAFFTPQNMSIIEYSGDENSGSARFARVRSAVAMSDGPRLDYTMVTDLYVHVKGASDDAELIYETREGEVCRMPLSEAWVISGGPNGTLYKIMENRVLKFDSITVRL